MRTRKFYKNILIFMLTVLSVLFSRGSDRAWAFSADVKNLSYSDPSPRSFTYDFSTGTFDAGTKTITVPTASLTYTFGPYPDAKNDIAVSVDLTGKKGTLSTDTNGGCVIDTDPFFAPSTATNQWVYSAQLQNFADMTDTGKEYHAQVGFGSFDPVAQPEYGAIWNYGGSGWSLVLRAGIYDGNPVNNGLC